MRDILGGVKGGVSPVEYLMLWIGLVASAVGLSLPTEIVSEMQNASSLQTQETNQRNCGVVSSSQENIAQVMHRGRC